MIAIIVVVVLLSAAATAAVVFVACVGAHQEPRGSLPVQAQGPLTGLARRILGLYVRKPQSQVGKRTPVRLP